MSSDPESLVLYRGGSPRTVDDVLRVVSHIHDLMTRAMKDGVHYGKLPGCPKPILYQPGADKLLLTFRLVPRYEVQDLSTADCAHFRITCSLYTMEGQVYLSSAIGECSSDEDKYQWRRAVCDAEYHMVFNNDPAKARIKWVRGSNDPYSIYMVKVPCADVANTILAMAEKRAKVRAVRSALAASDIFDVNLEDIAPELRQGLVEDEEHAPSGDDRDRAERAFREQRARSLGVETPGMAGKDEYDIPLTFGAHSGKSIRMLADSAPGYITWMAGNMKNDAWRLRAQQWLAAAAAPQETAPAPDSAPDTEIKDPFADQ